jgi:TIR domain
MGNRSCSSSHALILASWEANTSEWLDGKYFELRSKKRRLQDIVGDGGTLWIAVSRPTKLGRIYNLSFCLRSCTKVIYPTRGKFGEYAVKGDRLQSRYYPSSDAKLLLLALRFDPFRPINGPNVNQISNSIRTPRCLSESDVRLIEEYATESDRWSVFISYQRSNDDLNLATRLFDALQGMGVSVYRDLDRLRAGDEFSPILKHAVTRSHNLVVLIGRTTYESQWVRQEVEWALEANNRVVPILAGGDLSDWDKLSALHYLEMSSGLDAVVDLLYAALSCPVR